MDTTPDLVIHHIQEDGKAPVEHNISISAVFRGSGLAWPRAAYLPVSPSGPNT
jgi:hypothetical protein